MPPCNGNIFTGIISKSVSWFTLCKKFGSVQHQSIAPDLHPVPPPDCYDWSVTVFYQRAAFNQTLKYKQIFIIWHPVPPPDCFDWSITVLYLLRIIVGYRIGFMREVISFWRYICQGILDSLEVSWRLFGGLFGKVILILRYVGSSWVNWGFLDVCDWLIGGLMRVHWGWLSWFGVMLVVRRGFIGVNYFHLVFMG